MKGLAPQSMAGPGQPVGHVQYELLDLLSDRAKALVLGEIADMRTAFVKGQDGRGVKILDSVFRRVARGLYRYEQHQEPVDIDTTRW